MRVNEKLGTAKDTPPNRLPEVSFLPWMDCAESKLLAIATPRGRAGSQDSVTQVRCELSLCELTPWSLAYTTGSEHPGRRHGN